MALRFHAAVGTDLGTVRMNNEDSAMISDRLLLLADGMGGHAAGEVASVMAVRVLSEVDHASGADLGANLLAAGRRARAAMVAISQADPVLESLGTTAIAVASDGSRVVIGHIGDSRVYVLRDHSMYQVTTDHTHVQQMVELGQLSPEHARTHPYRAMLRKSLDDRESGPDLDVIEVQLQAGDRLLLCSDGLSDYLTAEQIGRGLAHPDREGAVAALIDAALQAATRDNVTVVVADVETTDPAEVLTEPTYAGAVADGIQLSEEAGAALREALPGFVLDPEEPWRGSGLDDEAQPAPAPEAADDDTSQGADEGAGRRRGEHAKRNPDDRAPGTGPPARPAPSHGAAATSGPEAGDVDESDVTTERLSLLPGVLAGVFTLAVLVAVAWILFG